MLPRGALCLIFASLATVAGLAALGSHPAAAQDEDKYLSADEIGEGTCSPDTLPAGTLTTCTFPLSGEGWEFQTPTGPILGEPRFPAAVSAPCFIEDATLICPDVAAPLNAGTVRVVLTNYVFEDIGVSFTVDREFDSVLGFIGAFNRLNPVYAGGSLSIGAFRAGSLPVDAPVDVLVRRPGSDEITERIRALESGVQEADFTVPIPDEPGRWEYISCAVDEDGTCFRTGIPNPIEALDTAVEPLIEDHNTSIADAAERINIVFLGTGFEDPTDLQDHARRVLTLDGEPLLVDETGALTEPAAEGEDRFIELVWGAFSIDPFRQNVDRFNFWFMTDISTASPMRAFRGFGDIAETDPVDLGLGEHVVLVNFTRWGDLDGYRATAELPNFAYKDEDDTLPGVPGSRADVRFGSVYLPVGDGLIAGEARTLAHEFGHALFGLRDEYFEFEQLEATLGDPNCVATEADAQEAWGDLIGQVDPMLDRYNEIGTTAGVPFFSVIRKERLEVGIVPGGCFGRDEDSVYRPTEDSLMHNNVPVFGSVNRRRVERVLDLWPEPTPIVTTTTAPPTTQAPPTAQDPTSLPPTTLADDQETENETAAPTNLGNDGSNLAVVAIVAVAAALGLFALRRRKPFTSPR